MKKLALYILSLGFLSSCEKMSNYDTPNLEQLSAKQKAQAEAFTGQFVTYSQLRTRVTTSFSQYEENDAFEGYVISSDESGNFYKKIYVQAPDKSGTLVVAIDQKGLYGDLPVGSKVQVRLQGTTLWYNSRYSIIEIGYGHGATSSGNPRIHSLPSSMYAQVVVPTTERVALERLTTTFENLRFNRELYNNQLITLKNVRFSSADVGKPYHNPLNQYSTTYELISTSGASLGFLTSKFATYANQLIPEGNLQITGVLTKFQDEYQFSVNTIEDLKIIN